MTFENLHIIITGGTGALGSAVTTQFIELGARCSIPCFDQSELGSFSLKNHKNVYMETAIDLTDEQATQQFYTNAVDTFGDLWGSIHIAGGFGMGNIEDTPKDDFMKQINMNLVTCYNCSRMAVKHFKSQAAGGRMVNIAARPALEPRQGAGMTAYTTAKAGVAALTQSLAAEVAEDDILVNAIAPSAIDTPQNRDAMPNADFDQWLKPAQLAKYILYLASSDNEITHGNITTVYGNS